ncbi:MAG: ABC transporter ATP-binding protein [Paracoccaceae bacterium]
MIAIGQVTKRFGSVTALEEVSFDIGKGEFFSLLGPSGCGKTTLLRILAGIESPTTGTLRIDGEDMVGIPPNRRPTNMVFQSYAIFPHLNVAENVGYGLRYKGIKRAEAQGLIASSLDMVQLSGFGDRQANQLSGGQRQRVALARALILKPKVLLLDEPLSALDKRLREEMQFELRELQRRVGITFVFVTHDQEEALTLSDRIAVMSGGRVLQIDTPETLYDRPASRRVAKFFGGMNLFPGRLLRVEGGIGVLDAGTIGPLSGAVDGPGMGDGPATLAIRPERIRMAAEVGSPGLAAQITAISFLGDRRQYVARIEPGGQSVTIVTPVTGDPAAAPSQGDRVSLSWAASDARILSD